MHLHRYSAEGCCGDEQMWGTGRESVWVPVRRVLFRSVPIMPTKEQRTTRSSLSVVRNKPKFLIVDDSRTIRLHLRQIIRQVDGEVIGEAGNGEDALKQFTDLKPDVMLLDVNMPKMDGRAALREAMALRPDAVVLMLTSQDTLDVVQECLSLGAKNYILKSNPDEVVVAELKAAVEQLAEAEG